MQSRQPILMRRGTDELIDAVARGRIDALAELYDAHSPLMYRVAFGITLSPDDAEDVVQDVFVGLARKLRTFQRSG